MSQQGCAACGGPLAAWLNMPVDAKKNEANAFAGVARCRRCGLGVLDPLPAAADVPGFYALESYYTHGGGHMRDVPPRLADRILTWLAWRTDRARPFEPADIAKELPAGARICDVGCGDALHLKQFKALGFDVLGVDPDAAARAQAGRAGVRVVAGTGEQIPDDVPRESFDLVIMTHSLEHCLDPARALQNLFELTRPGGLCYVEVPNAESRHFRTFTICSEMFDSPRHVYFFAAHSLRAMMEARGLRPIRLLYTGFTRNFDPTWRGWERTIAERVVAADPALRPRRHHFVASCVLWLQSFWQPPQRKYDSIGWLMRRPA